MPDDTNAQPGGNGAAAKVAGNSGGAAKVDASLPFAEQMRAIDPNVFDPEPKEAAPGESGTGDGQPGAEAEDTTEEPKEAKAKKGKTKIEVPADATAAELDQLKQLAEKLGFSVEEQGLTTRERAQWRKYTTEKERELQRLEAEANDRVSKATKEFEDRFKMADEVWDFKKTRDYQKLAKTLGFDDWDKLQEDVINHLQDPNYKRIREMEERLAQKERDEQERAQREEAARMEAQRVHAQNEYRAKLSADMAQSKDPLVREMADDPGFVMAVFRIQQEHYDAVRDATIPPEEAASRAIRGAAKPLRAEMKGLYDRLHKVFGSQQSAPEPKAGTVAKPKPRTDALPANKPSKVVKTDPKDRAWFAEAEEQMRQAAEEERRQRLANGYRS